MRAMETAEIGATGLRVTRLGLGGAALGGLYADVEEAAAVETVLRGLDLGIGYFDTAPFYGHGKSELFLERALSDVPRNRYVLSTKVGRLLKPVDSMKDAGPFVNLPALEPTFDFSRDGVLRSLEESLERLKVDRVEIALIHDADDHHDQALREAFPTLAELRSQGVIKAIGAGMNSWQPLARFAREADFDCFLLAGRYTLLDQSGLRELLPVCQEKGISVILGGPYNSGILASDLSAGTTFDYRATPPTVLERAREIKSACDMYGVPLKAAALQFGLAHPAVAATIPGARSPLEAEDNVRMVGYAIPEGLWTELRDKALIPEDAPTPTTR